MRLQGDIFRRRMWARLLLPVVDRAPVRERGLVQGMDGTGSKAYQSVWSTEK